MLYLYLHGADRVFFGEVVGKEKRDGAGEVACRG